MMPGMRQIELCQCALVRCSFSAASLVAVLSSCVPLTSEQRATVAWWLQKKETPRTREGIVDIMRGACLGGAWAQRGSGSNGALGKKKQGMYCTVLVRRRVAGGRRTSRLFQWQHCGAGQIFQWYHVGDYEKGKSRCQKCLCPRRVGRKEV